VEQAAITFTGIVGISERRSALENIIGKIGQLLNWFGIRTRYLACHFSHHSLNDMYKPTTNEPFSVFIDTLFKLGMLLR
jgi:hypothetical protein